MGGAEPFGNNDKGATGEVGFGCFDGKGEGAVYLFVRERGFCHRDTIPPELEGIVGCAEQAVPGIFAEILHIRICCERRGEQHCRSTKGLVKQADCVV